MCVLARPVGPGVNGAVFIAPRIRATVLQNVRLWHFCDIAIGNSNVRSSRKSGHNGSARWTFASAKTRLRCAKLPAPKNEP
jgi:hypothetical protein